MTQRNLIRIYYNINRNSIFIAAHHQIGKENYLCYEHNIINANERTSVSTFPFENRAMKTE